MDTISLSSHSRPSSVFSLDSYASSVTSNPPSPLVSLDEKRSTEQPQPFVSRSRVLRWKPQFFSAAFTNQTSTHIKFTAFPPCDYKDHLSGFDFLSWRMAMSILQDITDPTSLSIFATPDSLAIAVSEIPTPSNLPEELVSLLENDTCWQLYAISEPTPVPFSISTITASHKHYVAFKNLDNGVERYIFGPAGLSVHSVCQLVDIGRSQEGSVPPETLYLEEHTEVLCNKAAKWLYKNSILRLIQQAHEHLRVRWDRTMLREWEALQRVRETDLLS